MGSMVLPSQAYEVKLAPHPAPFSVLKFTGHDAVSQLYRYEVEFTSPVANLPIEKVLGRPAKFIIDPIDPNAAYLRHMFGENAEKFSDMPPARTVHGVVTQFVEFETSADETRYKLMIEPRAADLARAENDEIDSVELSLRWRASLESSQRHQHGWRWRYHDRWVLVIGDEPLVERLAPGLTRSGYLIASDTILLYARQTDEKLNTTWLDQIRSLRRRRPVDAFVVVTQAGVSDKQLFKAEHIAQRLMRHARALHWAAPSYLLHVTDFEGGASGSDEAIGYTWSNAGIDRAGIDASLGGLCDDLADAGVVRLTQDRPDRYLAELSRHIVELRGALSDLVVQTGQSRLWRHGVQGLLFAPLFKKRALAALAVDANSDVEKPAALPQRAVWQTVAEHSRRIHGRRVGFSYSTSAAWFATALSAVWIAGTVLSGFTNRATIQNATDTLTKLSSAQDRTQATLTLNSLQKQLDTLEYRLHDGAAWNSRFGLNRDAALLAALWPSYQSGVNRMVVDPIRTKLEERLRQLASLSDAEIASGGEAQIQSAYDTLKTYLMLAKPERADAAFLTPQLVATAAPARPINSTLSEGAWLDLREQLITFYAKHLGQHATANGTSLAIIPDRSLVNGARQTVIGVKGIQNSTDTLYQQILDDAKSKYPPVSLATLLNDAPRETSFGGASSRGLFNATATMPGVFTRAAWDERISAAIDEASEQRSVAGDWVLSDAHTDTAQTASLKAALRQRYFDDYASAWQQFLNGVRWQPTPTLSGTVDQLALLGDPQRSPLVALMRVVVYQAGAGATTQSLSDSLVTKAQQLVGADEKDPSKIARSQNIAPLASAFGPLLRLAGSDVATGSSGTGNAATQTQIAATGDLSLARFLERVTAMRLKLQQITMSSDPDAMARAAAQAVLQGKTSDIADSRDYASRVSASLGEQWAGFGDLFEQPLDQTWQVVLQPAAASLNDTWRTAIVADWDRRFGGRYPFADSDNDASLPEMARFMRPDNGLITQFVASQLGGIVERQGDQWVPVQGENSSALTVDPEFLTALNKLVRVSTVLFPSGDAHVRYELRGVPTPGITDMKFVLSGRELHYFNQKQEWVPFVWPGDALENITRVEWETQQGGLRSGLDMQGRFGLIRLLERAEVTPQDNARNLLSWTPDQSVGLPLKVQLRSEAGAGPLDVLALRHFSLPQRIFVTTSTKASLQQTSASPPSLPPVAIAVTETAPLAR